MATLLEDLLIKQLQKRPIIMDLTIENNVEKYRTEIDAAFSDIQHIIEAKLQMKITVKGLKNIWVHLKQSKKRKVNTKCSDSSSNDSIVNIKGKTIKEQSYLNKNKKKLQHSKHKKNIARFPDMDEFAKQKVNEVKLLDEQFKSLRDLFNKSRQAISQEEEECTSLILLIMWEKFRQINPLKYNECIGEIMAVINDFAD